MNKFLFISLTILITGSAFGHGKKHNTEANVIKRVEAVEKEYVPKKDTIKIAGVSKESHGNNDVILKSFPTLHPLVVHFPIVLLLIAPGFLILGWLFNKQGLVISSFLSTIGGFLGALVSSNFIHPHTEGLTPLATEILLRHECWAGWTVYLSASAILIFGLAYFFPGIRKSLIFAILLLLCGSTISVSIAGHEGAKLTHLHGVGPQGKYLELNH